MELLGLGCQYFKFGVVGGAATLTHVACFAAFIEFAGLAPLAANLAAFCIAVVISFFGQFGWTFALERRAARARRPEHAFARFLMVALIGLAANSIVVYLMTDVFALPYGYSIALMVTVVPLALFLLIKFWAFRPLAESKLGRDGL